ncbi:MAG: glycosyltransferase family 4 protein [Clostridia bacterium]|nr:glycosyltransferase family 4 protein [Clostridia bacterium]
MNDTRRTVLNDKKKILLVANVSKEHVLKFHVPTIKALVDEGWHVDVACSGTEEVPYCNTQFKMSWKRSPFNFALFKGIKELKKIVKDGQYDIIYCHTPVGALVARLAGRKARKKGTKIIYMAHGLHFFKGANPVYWLTFYPIEKWLSRFTDVMILVNQEDYDIVKEKFHHKSGTYLVCEIGTNIERFVVKNKAEIRQEYRKQLNIEDDATVLVYLAELIKNKNQTMLMRVLKSLIKEGHNVYLVLAGVDHTKGTFMAYANEMGVANRIRFLGWRSDVQNIYVMSDICTAASIREGFGINIVEAMAAGLPVVASDNRGHRTIIRDGENGFLVPLKDEELFAKRIMEVASNKTLSTKLIEESQKDIEKYSIESCVQRLKEILASYID